MRSKIVLRAAEGLANQEIARHLGVTGATVGKWRERYRMHGMEGLSDEPRPGTPRKITDEKVEEAVTQTLESLPTAATHWSTRSLAEKVGLSQIKLTNPPKRRRKNLAQFWFAASPD